MKSYVYKGENKIELVTGDGTPPLQGYAKVRISKLGLTDGDIDLFRQSEHYPFVAGRQAVGIISETAPNSKFMRNDRVYLNPYVPCEACSDCKTGHTYDCTNLGILGQNRDGFLRDFINIPETNIIKLPDNVNDKEAIFCEYVAMAMEIINKLDFEKGDHIVIMGGDILGNLVAQLCIYYHAIPLLIENDKTNLENAKKAGIYFTINANESAEKYIYNVMGGRMAKHLVYICGNEKSFKEAFSLVRSGAKMIISGFSAKTMMSNVATVFSKRLKVFGVNDGMREMRTAINMLATKAVDLSMFGEQEIKFSDIPFIIKAQAQKSDEKTSFFQVIVDCLK